MEKAVNFQINPNNNRMGWDLIRPKHIRNIEWPYAVKIAKRLASLYKAEVRMTTGLGDVRQFNGHYFNHNGRMVEPMQISESVMKLSKNNIEDILRNHKHIVNITGNEDLETMRKILQTQINENEINELKAIESLIES